MLSDRHYTTQLLEYQAKALLESVGIELLPAQSLHSPAEVRELRLPYPIALKSQVRARERARAGGIRFAANAIDAFASARAIFNLAIAGEYPEALLAEACFQSEREYYLAIILDDQLQRPVLAGALLDADGRPLHRYRVAVEEEFSPYYARRLSLRLGLAGEEMLAASAIIEKMYRLLVAKDLTRVEIDPLAISQEGQLAILDAKIYVDRRALGRHPDLAAWLPQGRVLVPTLPPAGILLASDCESLLLAMEDLLAGTDVTPPWTSWSIASDADPDTLEQQLPATGVLVASFGCDSRATLPLAEAIARRTIQQKLSRQNALPAIAMRIAGGPSTAVQWCLGDLPVRWCDDLETAIAAALALLPAASD